MLASAFSLSRHFWPNDRYLWPAAQLLSRARRLPNEQRIYRTALAFNMRLAPHAYPDGAMLYGTFEVAVLRWLRRIVRPGDAVADVGANIGYHSLVLSHLVGGKGFVHAFEPNPSTADRLQENLALNSCTNVVVHRLALGNVDQQTTIFAPPDVNAHGMSSLRAPEDGWQARPCDMRRLDELLADSSLHLIKLDIQGAEMIALQGASEILERHRPYIILEHEDECLDAFGTSFAELRQWLERGFNYRAKVIDRARGHSNVAFLPPRR
ncbi:MAG TPA: FkbM family methyltransferase [Stellaceae bacterium]|nr:FkbM family methyltransferase [Stellaceae bacterium]